MSKFLETHCFRCHDEFSKSGGLDLMALPFELETPANHDRWVEIHDRVQRGEMPPPDEVEAPPAVSRQGMLAHLAQELAGADARRQRENGRVPLRRLNRNEYQHTVRDLFHMPGLQVKELLPEDGQYDGFDKAASALEISAVQLRKYLEAADFVLDEAMAHEAQPMVFQHRFRRVGGLAQFFEATFPMHNKQVDLELVEWAYPRSGQALHLNDRVPYLTEMDSLGILTHARPAWDAEVENFSPFHSGFYRIKTSLWSFHLQDGEVLPTDRMQSFALTANGRLLTYFDAPSLEPLKHEVVVWLNEAETLQLNPANLWGNFDRAYTFKGPAVAVDYVDIEGPLHDVWPPKSHRQLFGDLPLAKIPFERNREYPRQPVKPTRKPGYRPNHVDGPEFQKYQPVWTAASPRPKEDAQRLLTAFLPQAFRRPVPPEEVAVYVAIAHARIDAGDFFADAMRSAYRVALCSPDFLFLREPTGSSPSDPLALDGYSVASRLSYFLWNSLPDAQLLEKGSKHQLGGQALIGEIDRMLADPRSDRFVEDFLDQWLDLREINFTSPDRRLYPEFRNDLRDAMLLETRAYFREMLTQNLPVRNIVDSDFIMINQRLAELYGIPGIVGSQIRRVPLPPDSPRGGLLTQAAVLKVTANGTSTSPVKRGAWVLDRILGRPPQPLPPDIPAVDPDVRGATTIRQQLDKHRSQAVCASCHSKMDPPGFALENFDVIGRWRDQYRFVGQKVDDPADRLGDDPPPEHFLGILAHQWPHVVNGVRYGLPVDASGQTVDGRSFQDIADFKQILLQEEEAIARSLVERLVLYATGAPVSFADRSQVERILEQSRESGYGLRTIIYEIANSGLLRRK